MAFINRTVIKPERLPLTTDAMYTIFFIFGLMFFEVMQQAFDMAIQSKAAGVDGQDTFGSAGWSPRRSTGCL